MEIINSEQRIFRAIATVETQDNQNETMAIESVLNLFDAYLETGGVIHEEHTNKVVGKVLMYENTNIEGKPAIEITAQIYKRFPIHNEVWDKIKNNVLKGVSIGGRAERNGDGILDMKEIFEIAVCQSPVNKGALINAVSVAKSEENKEVNKQGGYMIELVEKADVKKECKDKKEDDTQKSNGDIMNEEEKKKEDVKEDVKKEDEKKPEDVKEKKTEEVKKEEPIIEEPITEKEPIEEETKATLEAVMESILEIKNELVAIKEVLAPESKPETEPEKSEEAIAEEKKEEDVIKSKNIKKAETPSVPYSNEDGGKVDPVQIALGKIKI